MNLVSRITRSLLINFCIWTNPLDFCEEGCTSQNGLGPVMEEAKEALRSISDDLWCFDKPCPASSATTVLATMFVVDPL